MRLRWGGVVSVVAAAALLTASCTQENQADQTSQAAARAAAGQGGLTGRPAPDFTLRSLEGEKVSLSDLKGKAVMIDFWATWCPPCRRAMPHIQKVHEAYRDRGLVVLGINSEPPEKPTEFMKANGYTFTTLSDPGGRTTMAYGVRGIPTTVFVDAEGIVSTVSVGYKPEAELRRALQKVGL